MTTDEAKQVEKHCEDVEKIILSAAECIREQNYGMALRILTQVREPLNIKITEATQLKGKYCPKCGDPMAPTGKHSKSIPIRYEYECPNCGHLEFDTNPNL